MADSKKYNGSTWEHSLRKLGTSTDTITTLPADLYADGNNATVGLVGNMQQTGTPTPDNPVMPQECGERTENLFDEIYASHVGSTVIYKPVYVGDGTFTLSSNIPQLQGAGQLFLLSGDVTSGASTGNNDVYNGLTRSASSTDGYVTIGYRQYSVSAPDVANYNVMLNSGSTALPYEPYGIKIPISSANTTTPVYLGEVESERNIKQLVLTGQENWTTANGGTENCFFYVSLSDAGISTETPCISSHYQQATINNTSTDIGVRVLTEQLRIRHTNASTTSKSDFMAYLQQQYANGTPVTVWYVLAAPETGIVNEPIRKIGDYADTVSGISIPTISGADSFDVLTTLKPSEVSLTYTGWHDATVEEWDGGAWD